MVLQSGRCQNYTALFIWLFKRRQELVGYSEAANVSFLTAMNGYRWCTSNGFDARGLER